MKQRSEGLTGAPDGGMDKGQDIKLGSRELRLMGNNEIGSYATGQSGAPLKQVVSHCENQRTEYNLVDDTFLEDLRSDHTKIDDLMKRMGETRDQVSIVARTADGGFTRMLLEKNPDGHYRDENEDSHSTERGSAHYQDEDLFIFERGLKKTAA